MTTKFRGGMSELMRQASRLQRKVEKRKQELKDEKVEAGAGNGNQALDDHEGRS